MEALLQLRSWAFDTTKPGEGRRVNLISVRCAEPKRARRGYPFERQDKDVQEGCAVSLQSKELFQTT